MKIFRLRMLFAPLVAVAVLVAAVAASAAKTPPKLTLLHPGATLAPLVAKAKAEGSLTFYTVPPDASVRRVVEAFTKRWGITATWTQVRHGRAAGSLRSRGHLGQPRRGPDPDLELAVGRPGRAEGLDHRPRQGRNPRLARGQGARLSEEVPDQRRLGDRPAPAVGDHVQQEPGLGCRRAEGLEGSARSEMVADVAARHGVRVVVDEIHAPLVYDESTFVPYLRSQVASAGSAYLGVEGVEPGRVKAAVLIAGDEVRSDLARIPAEVSFGASHLGVLAQAAAFRDGGPGWMACSRPSTGTAARSSRSWRRTSRGGLPAARRDLPRLARLPGARAWPDPSATFLERARVALSPGPTFGSRGDGYARLNFATPPAVLAEAVERLARSPRRPCRAPRSDRAIGVGCT